MRFRIGVAISFVAACGSFGSATDSNDAGTPPNDAATPPEAGADGGCPVKRCIDFEPPAQNVRPYGFDGLVEQVDGGLSIGQGYASENALVAHTIGDQRSVGEVVFSTLPARVNVRLRVRPLKRVRNDSTSGHFIVFNCENGDDLIVKMNFDGDFSAQAGQDGSPFLPYADGNWYAIDATATFGAGTHALTAKVESTTSPEKVANNDCTTPLRLRIGVVVQGGSTGEFTLAVDDVMIDWN